MGDDPNGNNHHSNKDFRSQRQPSYTREDVAAARNNLLLLKKRMGAKDAPPRASSYSNVNSGYPDNSNDIGGSVNDGGISGNAGRGNRGNS
jgi:hypothetical protein